MENALNVAYHDVLDEGDSVWRVKCMFATRSNLVATWKVRLKVGIIY